MVKKTRNRKCDVLKKPINFLADWCPLPFYELMSYILMYASVPMLAYGIQVYDLEIVRIIILTILTMYSDFFAALIWNDITDADIDAIVHPDRPVPAGTISKKKILCGGTGILSNDFHFCNHC